MAQSGASDPYQGRFGIIRRIDDWIFHVEMGILWTFLGVSAVMVFLDVMYRRLAAPDSKVAELTARILGIESPEAIETLTVVAPIVPIAWPVRSPWDSPSCRSSTTSSSFRTWD